MLISHRKKFIFTKTVKTAGTSVESYFEKYCMPEGEWEFVDNRHQYVGDTGIIGYRGANAGKSDWFNHMPATDIREKIGKHIWDNYFKFTVIRNPFDKLISLYFFMRERGFLDAKYIGDPVDGFRRWARNAIPVPDREQYMIDSRVCIDYFIRYEDLYNDVKFVCDKLSLPFEPENIPTLKSGFRDRSIDLTEFYTKDIVQLVSDAYENEIEIFGYFFPRL